MEIYVVASYEIFEDNFFFKKRYAPIVIFVCNVFVCNVWLVFINIPINKSKYFKLNIKYFT